MSELKTKLPDFYQKYITKAAELDGYESADDYILDLVKKDYQEKQQDFEHEMLKGLNSGKEIEFTPEWWKKRKSELLKKYDPPPLNFFV